VHQVEPSVVYIAVTDQTTNSFGQTQEQQGVGSGVIFDNQGHILTNNHVVEGADTMTVILPDGRKFQASVVGRSPAHDIAVIKIDADNLPVATLGDSSKLDVGQWVVAIGNPLALSQDSPTVTVGVVSALGRTIGAQGEDAGIANLIQTDAAINPGNSGGPLLNLDGQVVGINTAKIQQAEGIGFAIPINDAKQIIDQALNGNAQASLGISGATVTPAIAARFDLPVTSGVIVADVEADSAAEAAGLQPGDVIVKLDDQAIATIDDLQTAITSHQPGDQVTLTVNRNGTEQQMPVTLGKSVVLQ
jgi:S1-C subfamily serine protease